jgi:hypothetical protein
MTGRVGQHPPAVRSRLGRCELSAEPDRLCFSGVQVVDCEVEMDLFRSITIGPSWCLVVTDPYRRNPAPLGLDGDEVVTCEGDLASQQLSPKCGECCGISAIERYRSKSRHSHLQKLPAFDESGRATRSPIDSSGRPQLFDLVKLRRRRRPYQGSWSWLSTSGS